MTGGVCFVVIFPNHVIIIICQWFHSLCSERYFHFGIYSNKYGTYNIHR